MKKIGLSGLLYSGKDFVAAAAGMATIGFADPIYQLVEHVTGTASKTAPGNRRLMQKLGQWGWGYTSPHPDYTWDISRYTLVELIRTNGYQMTKDFAWVDWQNYGKRQTFWADILLRRVEIMEAREDAPKALAVVNVRFPHEHQPLADAQFSRFHIMCTEETRQERMIKDGYQQTQDELVDASEQFAMHLNKTCPGDMVIWNDHRPIPSGCNFLTVAEFCTIVSA